MHLSVMSYNLRYDNAHDGVNAWGNRKDEAAAAIAELSPVVLGVQEATYPMLQELTARLPAYEWIGVGREGGLAGEFSAVLYQPRVLQPVAAGHFWLSPLPDVPGTRYPGAFHARMCSWVHFRRRNEQVEFLFYNTHLEHQVAEARVYGATLIRDRIAKQRSVVPLPAIVVGDMNANPSAPPLRALRYMPDGSELLRDAADWLRAQGGTVGCTYHGFNGTVEGEPIDSILYTGEWKVNAFSVWRDKVNGKFISDHYPILANLELAR